MLIRSIFCDQCKREIGFSDERITIFLENQYQVRTICSNCDFDIVLAGTATQRDIEKNQPLGTTLKLMLDRYN